MSRIRVHTPSFFAPGKLALVVAMLGAGWAAAFALAGGGQTGATAREEKPPVLEAIFPAVPTLPANHLKFYLYFSEPLARGDVFRHFSLTDLDSGKLVPEPFREVELWDETGTRLTLWFHPGRQKPGVNLNVEIGPILEEGKRYQLTVSGEWRSERGVPLSEPVSKEFTAGPMDNTQPDPARWVLTSPRSQTPGDALHIHFDEPLDRALVLSCFTVRLAGSPSSTTPLDLVSEYDPEAQTLLLHPSKPETHWSPGGYILIVRTVLEDLAGNSLARPFNLDLSTPSGTIRNEETIEFPFQVN